MPSMCEFGHGVPREWIEIKPGRQVFRCPLCHKGEKTPGQQALSGPRIKYGQQWFRDRELSPREQAAPPKKRSLGT